MGVLPVCCASLLSKGCPHYVGLLWGICSVYHPGEYSPGATYILGVSDSENDLPVCCSWEGGERYEK